MLTHADTATLPLRMSDFFKTLNFVDTKTTMVRNSLVATPLGVRKWSSASLWAVCTRLGFCTYSLTGAMLVGGRAGATD